MNRVETKFLLSLSQYHWFRERCRHYFAGDTHNQGSAGYPVLSAYFDTPQLKFFNQKINGEFDHHKIRIRIYGNSFEQRSFAFLEAKIKANDAQNKIRIPLPFHMKLLSPESWYDLDHPDIERLLLLSNQLIHTMNVYYEREAFEWEGSIHGKVRINFDSNLAVMPKSQLFVNRDVLDTYRLCPEDQVILEVKTPHGKVPDFLQKELRSLGIEQERISKYAEGMFALSHNFKGYEVSA